MKISKTKKEKKVSRLIPKVLFCVFSFVNTFCWYPTSIFAGDKKFPLTVKIPGLGSEASFEEWMYKGIIPFLIALAGGFAFIKCSIAVYQIVASQGNDTALKAAKDSLMRSLLGLSLSVLSYLILNALNPNITGKG